jgi:hypothetical protein
VITPPRRSVTRFFIPLIDVLILLFCIFLLMPFVSGPAASETEKEAVKKDTPPPPTDVQELQRQLVEAQKRLDRVQKERANLADRLSVRVLEIDGANGKLFYYNPDRQSVTSQADAQRLIDQQRRIAGAKDPFFLILYPRGPSGFPEKPQREAYEQWFKDVPHGFDKPY